MERVMLELNPAAFEGSVPVLLEPVTLSPELMGSFSELLLSMHAVKVAAVLEDLELYERTGHMTCLIEDVIRRAQCLAEADRIMEAF
jgi:hypothetical protein